MVTVVGPDWQGEDGAVMSGAKKYDTGKTQWHLLPWSGAELVVRVMEFGAEKYGESNWRLGDISDTRYINACIRHLHSHLSGRTHDEESGLPALAHAAANLLMLLSRFEYVTLPDNQESRND